uniref:hypothetical protein n=1 Tax=Bacillus cytotoxicus TaxID=580165 RepID=UPI00203A41D7
MQSENKDNLKYDFGIGRVIVLMFINLHITRKRKNILYVENKYDEGDCIQKIIK